MNYRELVGLKYKVHGRTKEEGFDCWGLIVYIYKQDGIKLPDPVYSNLENRKKSRAEIIGSKVFRKIENRKEKSIIEILDKGEPAHVGLYLGDGLMIHCTSLLGVVIEPVRHYEKKIVGWYDVCID